ncbi:MAG: helix-turn-helix domain-containing protein [Negativicutes bacterium]
MKNLTVGERVRYLRETLRVQDKKKYSLESVAQRIGAVTKQSLSLIERSKIQNPSSIILNKLAADFGVTVDYLLTGIGGYKEEFLQKRHALGNELDLCRQIQENYIVNDQAIPLLYEKISNLLELFDIINACLRREVLGNYDKYSVEIDKLIVFLKVISSEMQQVERKESQFAKFIDEAFWKLGKNIRQVAVLIDQDGNRRNFQPWELKKIADIAEGTARTYAKGQDVQGEPQSLEMVCPDFYLKLVYSGNKIISDEQLHEFKKRIVFEWDILINRLGKIDCTDNKPKLKE